MFINTTLSPLPLFRHENHVKHVVIESTPDPVVGIIYHITPSGPRFHTLYDLIEHAQKEPVIHNHSFEIILGKSPPKVIFTNSIFTETLA